MFHYDRFFFPVYKRVRRIFMIIWVKIYSTREGIMSEAKKSNKQSSRCRVACSGSKRISFFTFTVVLIVVAGRRSHEIFKNSTLCSLVYRLSVLFASQLSSKFCYSPFDRSAIGRLETVSSVSQFRY